MGCQADYRQFIRLIVAIDKVLTCCVNRLFNKLFCKVLQKRETLMVPSMQYVGKD